MKKKQFKAICLTSLITICFSAFSMAQSGTVVLNEDPAISKLLDIKKEMNKDDKNSDRYKIQIYSGNLGSAESNEI